MNFDTCPKLHKNSLTVALVVHPALVLSQTNPTTLPDPDKKYFEPLNRFDLKVKLLVITCKLENSLRLRPKSS